MDGMGESPPSTLSVAEGTEGKGLGVMGLHDAVLESRMFNVFL